MGNRHKKIEGSGHCCFDYTIIDTHADDCMGRGYTWVCEVMDEHYADLVVSALNAAEPESRPEAQTNG